MGFRCAVSRETRLSHCTWCTQFPPSGAGFIGWCVCADWVFQCADKRHEVREKRKQKAHRKGDHHKVQIAVCLGRQMKSCVSLRLELGRLRGIVRERMFLLFQGLGPKEVGLVSCLGPSGLGLTLPCVTRFRTCWEWPRASLRAKHLWRAFTSGKLVLKGLSYRDAAGGQSHGSFSHQRIRSLSVANGVSGLVSGGWCRGACGSFLLASDKRSHKGLWWESGDRQSVTRPSAPSRHRKRWASQQILQTHAIGPHDSSAHPAQHRIHCHHIKLHHTWFHWITAQDSTAKYSTVLYIFNES